MSSLVHLLKDAVELSDGSVIKDGQEFDENSPAVANHLTVKGLNGKMANAA